MKILEDLMNSGKSTKSYRFVMFERVGIVEVYKEGELEYVMSRNKRGGWNCPCSDSIIRKRQCKHLKRIPFLLDKDSETGFFCEVKEEYYEMFYPQSKPFLKRRGVAI